MTRSDRERKDAERAARRANRLAQRAQQRAFRKEEQAQLAVERAERLAERANRRPGRQKELDESIEDESITNRDIDMDEEFEQEQPRRKSPRAERRSQRSSKRRWKYSHNWDSKKWRFKTIYNRRSGNLYRDKQHKKICGVCAGAADYLGMATWKIRLLAVMGLVFIPSVAITVYFITYFLMDDKPYYRQVTDRFDDDKAYYDEEPRRVKRSRRTRKSERPEAASVKVSSVKAPNEVSNTEAMRKAKNKFMNIEDRLRSMETHVTSSTFELQRELKKISGDEV